MSEADPPSNAAKAPPVRPDDPTNLRRFAGQFPTGVAIVTARDNAGQLFGLTLNSITSVSLDPPLYLVCLGNASNTLRAVIARGTFGINFLSDAQRSIAQIFAGKSTDKFGAVRYRLGHQDVPLLEDAVATAVCRVENMFAAGDHQIVLGRVEDHAVGDGEPLIFLRGQFHKGPEPLS